MDCWGTDVVVLDRSDGFERDKTGDCSHSHLAPLLPVTRISYFAALARTPGAVSPKGNRMKLINATALDRKSGDKLFVASARNYRGVSCVPQSPGAFTVALLIFLGETAIASKCTLGNTSAS